MGWVWGHSRQNFVLEWSANISRFEVDTFPIDVEKDRSQLQGAYQDCRLTGIVLLLLIMSWFAQKRIITSEALYWLVNKAINFIASNSYHMMWFMYCTLWCWHLSDLFRWWWDLNGTVAPLVSRSFHGGLWIREHSYTGWANSGCVPIDTLK